MPVLAALVVVVFFVVPVAVFWRRGMLVFMVHDVARRGSYPAAG